MCTHYRHTYFAMVLMLLFFIVPISVFGQSLSGTTVHLAIAPQTWTPAFYTGRALPTNGSETTVTALVFNNGIQSNVPYQYIWKLNGKRQDTNPGSNTFTFSSRFDTKTVISVSVVTQQGTIAEKTITVPMVEPELYFYDVNPLRGISHLAVGQTYALLGEEATFQATPYYVDFQNGNLVHQWQINRQEITTENPLQLTIQKNQDSGTSRILFKSYNTMQPLQAVEGGFEVQF